MEELREEVDVRESLRRKLARSRLKWAGPEGLTKRANALRVECRMKIGRPILIWEDCVKRYIWWEWEGSGKRDPWMRE